MSPAVRNFQNKPTEITTARRNFSPILNYKKNHVTIFNIIGILLQIPMINPCPDFAKGFENIPDVRNRTYRYRQC
jgi:hypothetical protein